MCPDRFRGGRRGWIEAPADSRRRRLAGIRSNLERRLSESKGAIRDGVRGYELVATLILVGLVATWPGWYFEPTWNQVMTNAFATFLVTPVLIFGVDRALARARELREHPRHDAIRAELARALSVTVNTGATGTIPDLLPGLLDQVAERMRAEGIEAACEHTAIGVMERKDEMEAAVTALAPDQLKQLVGAVAAERNDVRQILFEAGPSLSAELYAEMLTAAQLVASLEGTERLLEFALTSPKQYDLDSRGGRAMRSTIAKDLVKTLALVAELYIDLRSGRK